MTKPHPRADGRGALDLRPITFELGAQRDPAGSVLVSFGATRVLCAVTVEERIPQFLRGSGEGWVTAEYGMLPGCSRERVARESSRGKPSGRGQEIGRLVGRSLRAAVDRTKLGERTFWVDCDVLQADGGTRTASITGGSVALTLAIRRLMAAGEIAEDPLVERVAAVSVGLVDDRVLVDLDYSEDSRARVDLNLVGTASGGVVEIQGTAEHGTIPPATLDRLVEAARRALRSIVLLQTEAIDQASGGAETRGRRAPRSRGRA